MTKCVTQLGSLAVGLLIIAGSAVAEVKLNDNFSVAGYIEGSYQYTQPKPGPSTDSFNIDSSQLVFITTFNPVKGVVSFFYVPNATKETTILDAYVTYDAGHGVSITGGKFLSYLGYESFFNVNNPEISFANGDFLAPIPGYHEGVKIDYSGKEWGSGVALLDSVYSGPYYLKGDGELKHNAGFEAYFTYKGVENLTLWGGLAFDTKGSFETHSITTLDFWGQYALSKATSLSAEFVTKDGGIGNKGYNWLVGATQAIDDKMSIAGRISGEKMSDGGPGFTKFTIAPSYAVTSQLTVRAELSYYEYKKFSKSKATFVGVQAYVKF